MVIGSTIPWIEAILIYLGVEKVTTLEYAEQKNEHPKIDLITPEALRKSILEGLVFKIPHFLTITNLSDL